MGNWKAETCCCDDDTWTIRYLVVKTGSSLSGYKVLIFPKAVLKDSWTMESLPVNLTKEQVSSKLFDSEFVHMKLINYEGSYGTVSS